MTALTLLRRSAVSYAHCYAPARAVNWRPVRALQRRQQQCMHTCGRPSALFTAATASTTTTKAAQAPNVASGEFKTLIMQIARAIVDLLRGTRLNA